MLARLVVPIAVAAVLLGGVTAAGAPATAAVASPPVDLRIGQLNIPGPDLIDRSTTRARRAAHQIRAADLDVVTLNELVGPGRTGKPSRFARSLVRALGPAWRIVTPTSRLNENYLAYRADRMQVLVQHPDQVVPGIGSGNERRRTARHVTPVLFRDLGSGRPVLVAATHLVAGDRPGAARQAREVGRIATTLAAGQPVVVAGDLNTSRPLDGFTRVGLKDARREAVARTNADRSTFVPYDRRHPRSRSRDRIDRIHVPRAWTVRRWVTVVDAKDGTFRSPRPSDHLLVWASLRGDA